MEDFLLLHSGNGYVKKSKGGLIMPYRNFRVLFLAGIILTGSLFLTQSVWAETLVESNVDTRVMVAMRVGQTAVQKLVQDPWKVISIPGGPLKGANFFMVFIDSFLVQDAQGKPDHGGINRRVAFAVPAKNTQSGEIVTMVTGGFNANPENIPGPYKNFGHATIQREHSFKGANLKPGTGKDSWEVRDNRRGAIELRIQYQRALPFRAKKEQKIYSATEPSFFRIYRTDSATDMVKSIPAKINRVQDYHLSVSVPELSNIFDGSEQLVGLSVIPLYVRQVFLP